MLLLMSLTKSIVFCLIIVSWNYLEYKTIKKQNILNKYWKIMI